MKKKELKKKIKHLESERNRAVSNEEVCKNMLYEFIKTLYKEYSVKADIIYPKPPMIECSATEDSEPYYIEGISTAPPTISFDFTEHDRRITLKCAANIMEEQRKGYKRRI